MISVDFTEASLATAWRPVHDVVMGGVSSGSAIATEEGALFAGRVSLEHGGGFASFRLDAELPDLSRADGLRLTVRGDGKVWTLSLRRDDRRGAVSWQAPFLAEAGTWTTVELPFADLAPAHRGRLVPGEPPLDPTDLQGLGLVLGARQSGPYALELAAVDTWHVAPTPELPGSRAAQLRRGADLARRLDHGAAAPELLDAMQWVERLVVVASPRPGELDARSTLQRGRLLARGRDLADRDLRVAWLVGDAGGRLAGRSLDPKHVRALREHWCLPTDAWQVALIGKDGGVKARWDELVEPEEILARIDAMPMRRREASTR